jgi:OFA family oxalate/formate antiporter-like MFS transporter
MGGLGCGFAYMSAINNIQRWLPHKRGLASGLAVSAFGLSTVVFAPVIKILIGKFKDSATEIVDFKSVFLILAGILIVLGLVGWFLSREPSQSYLAGIPKQTNVNVHSTSKNYKISEVVKTPTFWCMWLFLFCYTGTYNLISPIIVPLGETRNLVPALAVLAVSIGGITNTAGRLICAALSDKIGRVVILIIFSIVMLVCALFMTFVSGILYIVIVAVIAFAYGTPASVQAAMTTDLYGTKYAGTNYGVILLALGSSGVVFNLISTKLLDGDPTKTFIMATISAILAIAFIIPVGIQQKKAKAQRKLDAAQ